MWQTDNAPRREKRAPEHPSSIPLEIHIRQARERLEAERDELPALRAQVDALERQRASCTARYQRRRELDLAREIERLRTHAHEIESGARIEEYEAKMKPFLEAYLKRVNASDRPLLSQRREQTAMVATASVVAQDMASSNNTKQSAIVAEYLADMCAEPPRMHLIKSDVCAACAEAMILIPTKRLLTCPKCGVSTTYLDATTSAISFGDEVEFASFSYKRTRARAGASPRQPPPLAAHGECGPAHRSHPRPWPQASTTSTSGCSRCRQRKPSRWTSTSSTSSWRSSTSSASPTRASSRTARSARSSRRGGFARRTSTWPRCGRGSRGSRRPSCRRRWRRPVGSCSSGCRRPLRSTAPPTGRTS